MTISSTTNRAGFVCNGVTYQFPFDFKILAKSDLQVYLYNTITRLSTQLTLNVDYTVEIASPGPGGTVTLIGAYGPPRPRGVIPGAEYTLTLLRAMPRTQEIDFINGDSLDENNIEGMGDRITMMVQELDEKIGRSVLLPPSSSVTGIELPIPAAGKLIRWKATLDGFENVAVADIGSQVINNFWAVVLAAAGSSLAEALATMGLDGSLETFALPDNTTISSFMKTLLDDADAATARTTLGIAEIATQAETNAGTDDARIVTPKKLYATPGIYRKNAIINGDMGIAQRGTAFAACADGAYTLDRWKLINGSDAVMAISQNTTERPTIAQSGVRFNASLVVDVTTADASIGATQACALQYTLEGYDIRHFMGQQVTLSFWVAATKPGTYCVVLLNAGSDKIYPVNYTISQANTWEKKAITLTMHDGASGTWDFTNGIGLRIRFVLAAGSTCANGTNATWGTTGLYGVSGQVNSLDSADNYFLITGVQLEKGSVATPFEFRPFAQELMLCQRYYWRKNFESGEPIANLQAFGTSAAYGKLLQHPVDMRATPTANRSGVGDFQLSNAVSITAQCTEFIIAAKRHEVSCGGAVRTGDGLVAGDCSVLFAYGTSCWIDADAEL